MPVGQWNSGPDEHGGQRFVHVPSDSVQAADQHITALLIAQHRLFDTVLRPVERDDAGDLQGLEDAIVEIALDLGQRPDDFAVADAEPHAPAWHVVEEKW